MEQEIDQGKCFCCSNSFPKIAIHHIDGNRENNNKENLIPTCLTCHQLIHRGFNKKKYIESSIREKVFLLREILLIKFYK